MIWIQHISGVGKKYKSSVIIERSKRQGVWHMESDKGVWHAVDEHGVKFELPYTEYVPCDPPETWVSIVNDMTICEDGRLLMFPTVNGDRTSFRLPPSIRAVLTQFQSIRFERKFSCPDDKR